MLRSNGALASPLRFFKLIKLLFCCCNTWLLRDTRCDDNNMTTLIIHLFTIICPIHSSLENRKISYFHLWKSLLLMHCYPHSPNRKENFLHFYMLYFSKLPLSIEVDYSFFNLFLKLRYYYGKYKKSTVYTTCNIFPNYLSCLKWINFFFQFILKSGLLWKL